MCSFNNILLWCNHDEIGKYIIPHLSDLITSRRIEALNINTITNNYYSDFKKLLPEHNTKELLNWTSNWANNIKSPSMWQDELIDDIIEFDNKAYIDIMIDYFDSENSDHNFWLDNIESRSHLLLMTINYLNIKDKKLKINQVLFQL